MSRMEELNRYKRINSFKPLTRSPPQEAIFTQKKNIQPIVHKNLKPLSNDFKFLDMPPRKRQSQHQQILKDTIKKLPGTDCRPYNNNNNRIQRQTTNDEIERKNKVENVSSKSSYDSHNKDFEGEGVYEIKSYQLVEVSRKETEISTDISSKNMELCRKSAKQAAKFFHLAKVHKSIQVSNPYMKFVDKVVKKPSQHHIANKKSSVIKSKFPALENGELREMMNFMGIEVSTQTEKTSAIYWITKKNIMLILLLILLLSNVLLLFALGLNANCKLNDPFPSLQFWQKLYGLFFS